MKRHRDGGWKAGELGQAKETPEGNFFQNLTQVAYHLYYLVL